MSVQHPLSQRASQGAKSPLDVDSPALSLGPKACPRSYSPSIQWRAPPFPGKLAAKERLQAHPHLHRAACTCPLPPLLAQRPLSPVYTWANGCSDTVRLIRSPCSPVPLPGHASSFIRSLAAAQKPHNSSQSGCHIGLYMLSLRSCPISKPSGSTL